MWIIESWREEYEVKMFNQRIVVCSVCGSVIIKNITTSIDPTQWHIPTHAYACTECKKLSNKEQIKKAIERLKSKLLTINSQAGGVE